MLTGKAKEDFEKWWSELVWSEKYDNNFYSDLNFCPFSMQYGVYVDWFDSVGVMITCYGGYIGERKVYDYEIRTDELAKYFDIPTRHEARTKAIEKACEIYNETSKN